MNETIQVMLKTTLFFLFGCSLYLGQTIKATRISSNQTDNSGYSGFSANRETAEGVRAQNSGGGEGTGPNNPPTTGSTQQQVRSDLNVYLNQGNLSVSMNQPDNKFNRYMIYDGSGNLKRDQIISATNSYTVDISNLSSGNYVIVVNETPSNTSVSKLFLKP